MIKLTKLQPIWLNESEDDKYTHIGFGKFKEKGKEKDKDAPTFKKDDNGKFVETGNTDIKKDADKKSTPDVNIFDTPDTKKEPSDTTLDSLKAMRKSLVHSQDILAGKSAISPAVKRKMANNNKKIADIDIELKKLEKSSTTDSTKSRAGVRETNKAVLKTARKLGITVQKLGKTEYIKQMSQAAVSALTDANFHKEARALVAKLENNPKLAEDPLKRKDKKTFSDPNYKAWVKTTAWGSEYMNPSDNVDKLGTVAAKEAGYDGVEAIDAIAFNLKINGFKKLAHTIQSIVETKKSTSLNNILQEANLPAKEIAHYTGTREPAIIKFIDKNNINADKLAYYVRTGGMVARIEVGSAISGVLNNKIQKELIKKFGINESNVDRFSWDDYAYKLQNAIANKLERKKFLGWKFYMDGWSGAFEFEKKGLDMIIYATPMWDGNHNVPFSAQSKKTGNPIEFIEKVVKTEDFHPSKNIEKDTRQYLKILSAMLKKAEIAYTKLK